MGKNLRGDRTYPNKQFLSKNALSDINAKTLEGPKVMLLYDSKTHKEVPKESLITCDYNKCSQQ